MELRSTSLAVPSERSVSAYMDTEASRELDHTCRRVADTPPWTAWLICFVTICERWSFYAFTGPFQNYIQNAADDPLRPGALGLGQSTATLMVNVFLIISYVTPMFAGLLADGYFGRYRMVLLSFIMYILGVGVLFATSFPAVLRAGGGFPGLIIAMILISLALGGVKASLPPLLAEQCGKVKQRMEVTKAGERILIDPDATVQYVFDIYYWCMNIGAQSRVVATFIEKGVGFWAAYLMGLCAISCSLLVFALGRRAMLISSPDGGVLRPTFKILWIATCNGFRMDAARPDVVQTRNGKDVQWSDSFVDQLQGVLGACQAFTPFIIFWLCQSQMTTNTVSQAANMETHGVPNDLLPTINSITVILFLPVATQFIYPFLRRRGFALAPLRRVALGFLLEAFGMAYAAGVQSWIYSVGPCYSHPRACPASPDGSLPNHVNVAVQVPVYVLQGLSGAFVSPAGYEFAFTKAPKSMKSVIQAIYGLTAAGGSIIALALTPMNQDPHLVGLYAGVAVSMFLASVATLWFSFRP